MTPSLCVQTTKQGRESRSGPITIGQFKTRRVAGGKHETSDDRFLSSPFCTIHCKSRLNTFQLVKLVSYTFIKFCKNVVQYMSPESQAFLKSTNNKCTFPLSSNFFFQHLTDLLPPFKNSISTDCITFCLSF